MQEGLAEIPATAGEQNAAPLFEIVGELQYEGIDRVIDFGKIQAPTAEAVSPAIRVEQPSPPASLDDSRTLHPWPRVSLRRAQSR